VHVFIRKKLKQQNPKTLNIQSKLALYFTISHSKSILLISSNKNCFKAHCVKRDFPNICFWKLKSCLSHSWQTAIFFRSVRMTTHPPLVTHARDHWWTLDFANASLSPGVNSRAELVPSPRANARNGASRSGTRVN
jgi:hypothetical protein